jgi:hypothetical protein
MISTNEIMKDTEKKIRDILQRYYEIQNSIEILEEQVELLEELLRSNDLTSLFDKREGDGSYNGDSDVEKEVLFKEAIEKAIEYKRQEIKRDIARLKTAISIKRKVMKMIDKILTSRELDSEQKELISLYYIDKKYNKDSNNDVVNKFKQGKKYINYSDVRIEQLRNRAVSIISRKFVSINHLLKEV